MATKKKKAYTENKSWKIFVIAFPDSKNMYIGCTSIKDIRKAFREHYSLKFSLTKSYFEQAKTDNIVPQMFLLEEFLTTKNIAFSRMVAWGKLLTDNGYFCINGDTFQSYVEDMIEVTQSFYEELKDINIEEILHSAKNLSVGYKPRKTKNDEKVVQYVQLYFTPEENEIIEKRAAELGLNKANYCKQIALNGQINNLYFHASDTYLKELREAISVVKQAIVTIYKLGQYFPSDLAKIEELKNVIVRHYKDTVKESIKVNAALSSKGKKKKKDSRLDYILNGDSS